MEAYKIKIDALQLLMGIDSEELLMKARTYLKRLVGSEKVAATKQNAVEDMSDKEFIELINSMSKDYSISTDEHIKMIKDNRHFGVSRHINYPIYE